MLFCIAFIVKLDLSPGKLHLLMTIGSTSIILLFRYASSILLLKLVLFGWVAVWTSKLAIARLQSRLLNVDGIERRRHWTSLHVVRTHAILDLICRQQECVHNLAIRTDLNGLEVGPWCAFARHHCYLLLVSQHELLLSRVPRCACIVSQSIWVRPIHGIEVSSRVTDQQRLWYLCCDYFEFYALIVCVTHTRCRHNIIKLRVINCLKRLWILHHVTGLARRWVC